MVIGIDGSRAFISHRTGIEEYSYQVIKNLRDKLDGHEVVLYVRKTQEMSFPPPLNEDKLRRESSKTNLDCGLDSRLRGNDKIIKPNLAIYLQTSPEKIMSRDRVPDQGLEYLEKKKEIYDRKSLEWKMKVINGDQSKEEVFGKIIQLINFLAAS